MITHWHGDHILGLPGLIQTLAASNYQSILEIYGPVNSKKYFDNINKMFINQNKISIKLIEIKKNGLFYKDGYLSIEAIYLNHTSPCLAYSIKENDKRKINIDYTKKFGLTKDPLLGKLQKGLTINYKGKKITPEKGTIIVKGKKITLVTDTSLCKEAIDISKDSDLLICESTFTKELANKAKEYQHLTSEQAAQIAKQSKSKRLILTHISQRYKLDEAKKIEDEAKKIFKNVIVAKDFLKIEI